MNRIVTNKFEIRILKSETISKFEFQNFVVWIIQDLDIRACLEFRASNLEFIPQPPKI